MIDREWELVTLMLEAERDSAAWREQAASYEASLRAIVQAQNSDPRRIAEDALAAYEEASDD